MKWCTEGGQRPKPLEGAAAAAAAERGGGGGGHRLAVHASVTHGGGGGGGGFQYRFQVQTAIRMYGSNCDTGFVFKLQYSSYPLDSAPAYPFASLSLSSQPPTIFNRRPPPLGRPPPCLCRQRRQVHEEAARHFKLHHLPHRIASSEWVKAHDGNEKLVATPPPPPM